MKNIITTCPKSRYRDWAEAEQLLKRCDGETIWPGSKRPFFWTIVLSREPKTPLVGQYCYIVFDGQVRGYFDVVDLDTVGNWIFHKRKRQTGRVLVMANWHSIPNGPVMTGFQGWRYTTLTPLQS